MKISHSPPNHITQTYSNQANIAVKPSSKLEKSADEVTADSINFSPKTKDLQKISAAMDIESTDRTKMVADLKQQVQANQYTVNANQVAEKMIGSLMNELG